MQFGFNYEIRKARGLFIENQLGRKPMKTSFSGENHVQLLDIEKSVSEFLIVLFVRTWSFVILQVERARKFVI